MVQMEAFGKNGNELEKKGEKVIKYLIEIPEKLKRK